MPGETVLERWAEKSHLSEEKAEGGKALYWGSSVEAAVCSKQGKYRWGEGRGGPRATLCKSRDCLLRKPWNMWQVIRAEERIWQLSWCSDQHRKMEPMIDLSLKKKKSMLFSCTIKEQIRRVIERRKTSCSVGNTDYILQRNRRSERGCEFL